MLIAFIGVVFIAVAFQMHLVNRQVTRTLGEVHGTMLSQMYQYNTKNEEYNRETVKVIWSPQYGIPSSHGVPRLGLFRNHLPANMRIYSHWVEQHGNPDPTCGESPPCKRTKAGGGLDAGSMFEVAFDGISTLGEGDYFGWLFYNGEAALIDMTGVRETLQDVQQMGEKLGNVMQCVDDVAACAWDCLFGNCPWD
jgi:hypothetical protein